MGAEVAVWDIAVVDVTVAEVMGAQLLRLTAPPSESRRPVRMGLTLQ
jgi:hypothetical protein